MSFRQGQGRSADLDSLRLQLCKQIFLLHALGKPGLRYEAHCDYYTKFIQKRDDWEFAGIYSDEGVTGTSDKKREGFSKMVEDALAGKIDLILTKSVSRFARNTVDSLRAAKQPCVYTWLKLLGVIFTALKAGMKGYAVSRSINVHFGQCPELIASDIDHIQDIYCFVRLVNPIVNV